MTSRIGNKRGFTFVEVVFVAIVLGIVMVTTLPAFRLRWDRFQEERTAFAIAQSLRVARSLAIAYTKPMAWVFEAESRRMWISQAQEDGASAPVPGSLGSPRRLPDDVTLHAMRDGDPVDRIGFFPDGTAEATQVTIGDPNHPHYSIAVDAATGRVILTPSVLPAPS